MCFQASVEKRATPTETKSTDQEKTLFTLFYDAQNNALIEIPNIRRIVLARCAESENPAACAACV